MNPLPPERLLPSDRERSSVELGDGEEDSEATTGGSSNADIEDNLDVDGANSAHASTNSNTASLMHRLCSVESSASEWISNRTGPLDKPFEPDPDRLDPHMEQLCKNIRKLSVASSSLQDSSILVDKLNIDKLDKNDVADGENSATNSSAYQTAATAGIGNTNSATENGGSTLIAKVNGNNNKIKGKYY